MPQPDRHPGAVAPPAATLAPPAALATEKWADGGALALLRAYEPVIMHTRGEQFLPTAVDGYVRACGLWVTTRDGHQEPVAEPGELTLEALADIAAARSTDALHLRFVHEPFGPAEVRRWRRQNRPSTGLSGRLAAVGMVSRVIDVLVKISLVVRGTVPGGLAAAAATQYQRTLAPAGCTYYGRVVRDGGFVVCQYWFFYAMNDWRTTFGGLNEHEADWETVSVYLAETPEGLRPAWVAASTHESVGDNLRRRWDDPDLRRRGDHPVVFVGAGSHSGAILPGDYLIAVNPKPLRPLVHRYQQLTGFLLPWTRDRDRRGIAVPFIDYARGDGPQVGPGGAHPWQAVLIDDDTPWVRSFRGLWGRDTRDWLSGERAPAGPRYNRDGTVRTSWADPVGWAGLHKVAPDPAARTRALAERVTALDELIAEAEADIEERRRRLRAQAAELASLRRQLATRELARERAQAIEEAERELAKLSAHRTRLAEERAAHRESLRDPLPPDPPQAHLRDPHLPYRSTQRGRVGFLRVWAALSIPLFILTMAALTSVPVHIGLPAFAAVLLAFTTVEALARRKLLAFLASLGMLVGALLVLIGLLFLLVHFRRLALVGLLGIGATALLVANVRDLRR
ncbi:ATP synthase subunit B family protein [Goodfellowiella coeruleoviolacea]|uniref:Uncharacterized protein n=1 Tax=Goodfellowiella coeruleoviolacea TaxID=334858 RepID=A0AAE3KIA6_9PSEU|nr:hypothetical protein [Goodfellowiella coeruleoviolacea]MCP2168290.1 hypothetical protein [Goodfellowiella coeruleoviolacea]